MRRTKEDAALTRENLLDAALASFHARGYMATTLDDIARQAGITRGAIAWHFGNKAELLNAVIRERYARATMRMLGICLSSCACALALALRDANAFAALLQTLITPVMFLSGILLPLTLAPRRYGRLGSLTLLPTPWMLPVTSSGETWLTCPCGRGSAWWGR